MLDRKTALENAGFENLFEVITKEEALNDSKSEYNKAVWTKRIESLDKYENTIFYKQDDKIYGMYTTEDGVRRMLEITYHQIMCSGLLREYEIFTFDNIISLKLLTPKGMGIDQSIKGVKAKMKELSEVGHLFTKAI